MRIRTSSGDILLEEFMKPLGLSGNELTRQLKVPVNRINDIVRGRREISADTALRLARYFGTTARFWLNAQAAYALSKAEAEVGDKIASQVRPRALRGAERSARGAAKCTGRERHRVP